MFSKYLKVLVILTLTSFVLISCSSQSQDEIAELKKELSELTVSYNSLIESYNQIVVRTDSLVNRTELLETSNKLIIKTVNEDLIYKPSPHLLSSLINFNQSSIKASLTSLSALIK